MKWKKLFAEATFVIYLKIQNKSKTEAKNKTELNPCFTLFSCILKSWHGDLLNFRVFVTSPSA